MALNGSPLNGTGFNGSALNGTGLNGSLPHLHPTPSQGIPVTPSADVGAADRSFGEIDDERARLEAELASASARVAAAHQRLAVRDAEMRATLRAELVASKDTLARMEREYEMAIAMVRQAGRDEADRLRAAARQAIAQRSLGRPSTPEVTGVE